jgi:hypothetical protein
MLANSTNHKCQQFSALDGLRHSWAGELAYAFPPVQLITRVLQKVRKERGAVVMGTPEWPSRTWWNLMAGAAEAMVRLGKTEEVLERAPSMAANRAKLPPGNMIMALLSFEWERTTSISRG